MTRTHIQTDAAPKAIGSYSQAVRTGQTVYLSGQIPLDPATMELVEGELLSAVFSQLRPAALPRGRAMRIIAGMCHGLGYAHERGLVHADFKPGNVILAAGDVPKILDFGLAHAATAAGVAEIVSSTGKAGKPLQAVTLAYSSCNRLKGGTPEFSDDVYSLSCVI